MRGGDGKGGLTPATLTPFRRINRRLHESLVNREFRGQFHDTISEIGTPFMAWRGMGGCD
jgi:hypothetical protein